jgi:8-oxo-dGTP pyrophosphatase MutT (NUDIX family)
MIKPWPTVGSKHIGDFRVFSLRSDTKVSPRTGEPHDFYILDCVNWVNVLALTPENQLVMIEQYRHGSNTVELEIPGGVMDPRDASPLETGLRELREETGYEAEQAAMSNRCFTVLARNCQLKHEVQFDHGEDLLTRLIPAQDVPPLVATGQIRHSLVVVALYYFDLWERRIKTL